MGKRKGAEAQTTAPEVDRLFSIPTVAELLDVSEKTVQRLVKAERLRTVRITAGRVGILRSEYERYLASCGDAA